MGPQALAERVVQSSASRKATWTVHDALLVSQQQGTSWRSSPASEKSSELRLGTENICMVTNDAQTMSELSPSPTTTYRSMLLYT